MKITKIDHFGRGITFDESKIVFVKGALPTEEVNINIYKEKSKLKEAIATEIITKSKDRIEPICPFYGDCGGCNIMHANFSFENQFKENKVKEILKKMANLDEDIVKTIIYDENRENYRNKVTLKVNKGLGFFKEKSSDLVKINSCYLVNRKINEIIKKANTLSLKNITELQIKKPENTSDCLISLKTKGELSTSTMAEFTKLCTTLIINEEVIFGSGYVTEKIGENSYKMSTKSFFQVNTKIAEILYDRILNEIKKGDNVLDLYCGTGTIGIHVSKKAGKVVGIELNKETAASAIENKKLNKVDNIEFICGDAAIKSSESNFKPDSIILDPPRIGLSEQMISELISFDSNKIIYVSCDPATLARDIKRLEENYEVTSVTPFNMFPNTYHVENLCILTKKTK